MIFLVRIYIFLLPSKVPFDVVSLDLFPLLSPEYVL